MIQKGNGIVILCMLLFCGCQNLSKQQFTSLPSKKSGITFNNVIEDHPTINILQYEYVYNGGGVAIGDLNNDELQDVVFTGNIVDNAVYLNQGNMKFKDITQESGVLDIKRWNTGISLIDINVDGLLDIYICASGHKEIKDKSNILFINQGPDESGIPHFVEMGQEYGIADTSSSTMAAFFDYDNDEDLDLIVVSNVMPDDRSPSRYRNKLKDGSSNTDDHLYENTWDETLGHPVFKEVSEQAGILIEGFSLGLNITDINEDGWKDIYITNDYLSNDLLYINNQDGTFTNKANEYFKHTSFSAMGNDVIDLDNDGHPEIVTLDMLPEDNYRRKTMLPPMKYTDHYNNEKFDFEYQYVRNTLQKNNRGMLTTEGIPLFTDVAFMSGIAATDWSWTPLIADFDNDSDRDMIITNGFPKDVTDRDFVDYSNEVRRYASDELLLGQIPAAKLKNYAYMNMGNLKFKNVTAEWGINQQSFSNGAAYGDLDNDGDLDYIVNNINDEAFVFQNNNVIKNNWIRIKLDGPDNNPMALGANIHVFYDSSGYQKIEFSTVRGYLSSHEPMAHFGLGHSNMVDSIIVEWSHRKTSKLYSVKSNQSISIAYSDATDTKRKDKKTVDALFSNISREINLDIVHQEDDYIDFSVQPLLIHKLSQFGPGLSVGDANNDGLEDLYISGSHYYKSMIYVQQENGTFYIADSLQNEKDVESIAEELGGLFFDADGDGDQDIYATHGGYEFDQSDAQYIDVLYINENGKYFPDHEALPAKKLSTQSVRAGDFDRDGDLDLFVAGRVTPYKFPSPVSSYILENQSSNGKVSFKDVTNEKAPFLNQIGMITDALWTDYNNDNLPDLILTGEFMPLTILKNTGDNFQNDTKESGISEHVGLWNSITSGDFDLDGDIDYITGNQGINFVTHISPEHPLRVYYKDFDNNGSEDLITTCYFPDLDGSYKEYTYYGSTDVAKQYNAIRSKFQFHKEYAVTTMSELFSEVQMKDAYILSANNFNTSYIENLGEGKFKIKALPDIVQRAPVFGMLTEDVNSDGLEDILIIGNDYGTDVSLGRLDAHDGLVGIGDGRGNFKFLSAHESGFFVQEDAKALVKLYHADKKRFIYIASQNRGPLLSFTTGASQKIVNIQPGDTYAIIKYKDGNERRHEFYYGNGFISQSSRKIQWLERYEKIEIYTSDGLVRTITKKDFLDSPSL